MARANTPPGLEMFVLDDLTTVAFEYCRDILEGFRVKRNYDIWRQVPQYLPPERAAKFNGLSFVVQRTESRRPKRDEVCREYFGVNEIFRVTCVAICLL